MSETMESRPELDEKLSELEILSQSLKEAKQKEKDALDQLIRLGADFENYRKRSEGRIQEARQFGKEEVLANILTLADALTQAVQSMDQTKDIASLKKGLTLVHQQFEKFLKDQGLSPIESVGQPLDPHRHEALGQVESHDMDEGQIVDELQRGYMMGQQVVRTAKVRVATKPKK